jgi:hypothetical protein
MTDWHKIKLWVVGDTTRNITPKELRYVKIYYLATTILFFTGGFSILYSKLLDHTHTPAHDYNNEVRLYALSAGTALLHVIYLGIAIRTLILDVPKHKLRPQSLSIPTILTIAYILILSYALLQFYNPQSLLFVHVKRLASIAFLLIYLLWAIRDYIEIKEAPGLRERQLWFILDLLLIVAIVLDLSGQTINRHITIKDLTVFAAISLFAFFRWASEGSRLNSYVTVYRTLYQRLERPVGTTIRPAQLVNEFDKFVSQNKSELRVLDFGSGDSSRLIRTLEILDPQGRVSRLILKRFDKQSEWKEMTWIDPPNAPSRYKTITESTFSTSLTEAKSFAQHACIIHASHVLYDRDAIIDFVNIIHQSQPGTLVIIRGFSESIFRDVSVMMSIGNPNNDYSYLWDTEFIRHIERAGNLIKWPTGEAYILKIQQWLPNTGENIQHLVNFLRILYGTQWTDKALFFLEQYFASREGRVILCNERILFYKTR